MSIAFHRDNERRLSRDQNIIFFHFALDVIEQLHGGAQSVFLLDKQLLQPRSLCGISFRAEFVAQVMDVASYIEPVQAGPSQETSTVKAPDQRRTDAPTVAELAVDDGGSSLVSARFVISGSAPSINQRVVLVLKDK